MTRLSSAIFHAFLSALAIVLTALCASPAFAADESARKRAEPLFKAGLQAFRAGEFERAHLEFLQAYELYPRGSILRNLGLCELQLGQPLEALKHLRAALASTDLAADQRSAGEHNLQDAYAQTGHISVHAKDGATLRVDGQAAGQAPLGDPVDVLPGKHTVEAQLSSRVARVEVDAAAGVVATADVFDEQAQASSQPSQPQTPLATAAPPPPVAPAIPAPPAPGIPSSSSDSPNADRPLPTRSGPSSTLRIVTTSALVAAAAGAAVAGVLVLSQANSDQHQSRATLSTAACQSAPSGSCAAATQLAQNADSERSLSTALFIAAGGLVGGAVVSWLLLAPRSAAAHSATVLPELSPTSAALSLRASF